MCYVMRTRNRESLAFTWNNAAQKVSEQQGGLSQLQTSTNFWVLSISQKTIAIFLL